MSQIEFHHMTIWPYECDNVYMQPSAWSVIIFLIKKINLQKISNLEH